MKKMICVLLCAMMAASLLTACQKGAEGSSSAGSSSASSTSQASSSPSKPAESPSGGIASSSAPSVPSSSEASSEASSGSAAYAIKLATTESEIDGISASLTVPVMEGEAAQTYNGVNSQIDRMAYNAARDVISSSTYQSGTLTLTSETPLYTDEFMSIVFTIEFNEVGMEYPVHAVKTANILLRQTSFADFGSAIQNNDALSAAAVKNNTSPASADELKAGLADAALYFTATGAGFAIPVSHEAGDVAMVVIPYGETGGFKTSDPVWDLV